MKNKTISLVLVLAALLIAVPAFAQTATVNTTTSAAVSGGAAVNQIPVTSATGITASTVSAQTFCLVDHEVVQVRVSNTTTNVLTVLRAVGGLATPHVSGSVVMCGPGGGTFNVNNGTTNGVFLGTAVPVGSCTATSNQFLPVVSYGYGGISWKLYDCKNGSWIAQNLPGDNPQILTRYCTPPGMQSFSLLTSFNLSAALNVGTVATPVAGTQYYNTIEIPTTMRITGISILNGVGATDKYVAALHRADGVTVANSAVAGVTAVGTDTFQDLPFTAVYLATGPARYWIDLQVNGTSTRYRAIPNNLTGTAGLFAGVLGSSFLGTFGTIQNVGVAIAAGANQATTALPTGLVTNVTPVACVY